MNALSFAEKTRIGSILRELMQGDGVHEEDKSAPMISSLVTDLPCRPVPVLLEVDERFLRIIEESGAFTHEKSIGMYGHVVRLRPKQTLQDYRRLFE